MFGRLEALCCLLSNKVIYRRHRVLGDGLSVSLYLKCVPVKRQKLVRNNGLPQYYAMVKVMIAETTSYAENRYCQVMLTDDTKNEPHDIYKDGLRFRIARALVASGKEYATIARECNVRTNAIYGWIKTGRIANDTLRKLAASTGTSVDWLISGEGEAIADTKSVMVKLPVLCWNRIQDRHRLGEVTVVASESIDAECYALIVQGNAMRGEFPDGSIVIVNPEVRPAPGNYVVASVHGAAVLR